MAFINSEIEIVRWSAVGSIAWLDRSCYRGRFADVVIAVLLAKSSKTLP